MVLNDWLDWLFVTKPKRYEQRRRKRGGGGGQGGGGQAYPLAPPPNNPPTFSFNFNVKQEKKNTQMYQVEG